MNTCLGWGSLIWNPGDLPVEGVWNRDGPQLPVEYTRVSGGGRLTLVVTHGAPLVQVLWSSISATSLEDGVQALAERESIPRHSIARSIGVWSADRSSPHPETVPVGEWATERGIEGVIWTALKPGFPESRGKALTCEEALAHLHTLEGVKRADAEEYIRRTPVQVRTPYRIAIEHQFGWTPT